MIDPDGFRPNVGIILSNADGRLLWARRIGQDAWQFPQGGIRSDETPEEAMYRELAEVVDRAARFLDFAQGYFAPLPGQVGRLCRDIGAHRRRVFWWPLLFFLAGTAAVGSLSIARGAHAAGKGGFKFGLIGCGGQGTRDLVSCVNSSPGVEIVAMGDLFEDRLTRCREQLDKLGVDVPASRCFTGFDAYQKVLDCDIDLVILATPPGFR